MGRSRKKRVTYKFRGLLKTAVLLSLSAYPKNGKILDSIPKRHIVISSIVIISSTHSGVGTPLDIVMHFMHYNTKRVRDSMSLNIYPALLSYISNT